MRELLLGIDIGTSSCKAAVFEKNGTVAASASAEYPVFYPETGWAQQQPEDWYRGVCAALSKIWASGRVRPEEISAVGIDGQGWSAIALDRTGKVLCPTPIWMDTRAEAECREQNGRIGAERIFGLCGNSLNPSYTTPKILWYRNHLPQVFEKTSVILHANGYIGYCLTGALTEDICDAYGWHCFDMRTGKWDLEMAEELGIPETFLPEIVSCDQVIGRVTKAASAQTGLKEGTPVAAGGLDAACAALGAGVLHDGDTQEQGGQAGGMSICLDTYRSDPGLILSFHVVPGKWLLQGGTTGGSGVMRWFEKEFGGEERHLAGSIGKSSFEQFSELAETVPPGSEGLVFLPYMNGERSPIWNPKAKGVFYGLDFSKTKAHMIRACMEGVACSLQHNLETAERAGASVKLLRSVGGAANSEIWTQIKSDLTGKPVAVPSSDTAATLGSAILAGVGTGFYQSYEEAVGLTVRDIRKHEPDPGNREVYEKTYQVYRRLYGKLEDMMS